MKTPTNIGGFVYRIIVPTGSRKRFKLCHYLNEAIEICRASRLRPLTIVREAKNSDGKAIPLAVATFK